MNDNKEQKESIKFLYSINGKSLNFDLEVIGENKLDIEDIVKKFETFLVMCGFVEPPSYVNSKDLVEKLRKEWEEKHKNETGTN